MEGFADYFDDELLKADVPKAIHSTHCIVIEIKNNNPITLQNLTIGNANENLQKQNFGLPPNVTVTCKNIINKVETHITYEDYLKQSKAYHCKIGVFYVESEMGLKIDPTVISDGITKQLFAAFDPYRQKNTIFPYNYKFSVNGKEQIILSELHQKSTCKLHLYLSEKTITHRGLSGHPAPQITK